MLKYKREAWRRAWRRALRRLEAYEPKELIANRYRSADGCCAIGVILPQTRRCSGGIATLMMRSSPVRTAAKSLGLSAYELMEIQTENDLVSSDSKTERYARVLAYVRRRAAEQHR